MPTPVPATSASAGGAHDVQPRECKNWMLKPEMYATAQITVEQRRALAIPRNAILHLGEQTVVFLDLGEKEGTQRFERVPVWVDEGESSNWLVVQRGLSIGQRIVTNGAIKLAANLQ